LTELLSQPTRKKARPVRRLVQKKRLIGVGKKKFQR
jgi:hypothetical protein